MVKKISVCLVCLFFCMVVSAGDSIPSKYSFLTVNAAGGFVLPTEHLTIGKGNQSSLYSAFALKYGFTTRGNKLENYYFGLPYYGIGVYIPRFSYQKEMGHPFSAYIFMGGTVAELNSFLSFNYEINLGASFNWNRYDMNKDPDFTALGSSVNVHLAGSGYLNWRLSDKFDLHTGISLNHFSNGALRTPNNGLNAVSSFVELAYYFNRKDKRSLKDIINYTPPEFKKSSIHDITVMYTTHTLKIDSAGTGMESKYPRKQFNVVGISYSYMQHNTRRFMWGPSLELVYDESINASFTGKRDPKTGIYREYYRMAGIKNRFSVGVSLKGEITMPGYAIFVNLGYDIYHKDRRVARFYQIYGGKVNLSNNLFATFSVRSTNVTRSQYLHFSLGYRFRHYRK